MMNTFFLCHSSLADQSPGGPPAAWQGPDLKISKTEFRNTFLGVLFHWFGKLQNECCTTKNVAELGWETADVIDLIQQLRHGDYIDSEWCENGRGTFAACDAYSTRVKERIEAVNKDMMIEYFVKFAVNKLGTMVMTISCHT